MFGKKKQKEIGGYANSNPEDSASYVILRLTAERIRNSQYASGTVQINSQTESGNISNFETSELGRLMKQYKIQKAN